MENKDLLSKSEIFEMIEEHAELMNYQEIGSSDFYAIAAEIGHPFDFEPNLADEFFDYFTPNN